VDYRGETVQNEAGLCPAVAHKKYLGQMHSAFSLKGRFQCEKPYSPQGTPSVCPVLPQFAKNTSFACFSGAQCHDLTEMRQNAAR
jgi:hypothetical protein